MPWRRPADGVYVSAMRTTTVTKLALTADGVRAREIRITLPWSPGFGAEPQDDRQPQQQQSQKRIIEPRHAYEHKRRSAP